MLRASTRSIRHQSICPKIDRSKLAAMPFLDNFRVAEDSGVKLLSSLFNWPRTGDEDIHESLGALLPVRAGRHVGDANERPQ